MKTNYWFALIPLFGNFFAYRKLKKLHEEIEELRKNREKLINDLGGDIDKLKILLGYHGSVEKIETLLKNPTPHGKDDELMVLIQEKYGSLRSMTSMLEDLEQKLTKKEYELENLHLLLGGRDNLEEIKTLKDNYGSFSRIHEKIQSLENLTKNIKNNSSLQENLDFIEKIKKFGDFENIQNKLSQFDDQKEKISKLSFEKENLSRTIESLRKNMDFVEKIKKYGNFEDIQNKLSQFDIQREKISQLSYEKDHLSRTLNDLKDNLNHKSNKLQSLLMDIGGEGFVPKIKQLRDSYGSFDSIESSMKKLNFQNNQMIEMNEKNKNLEEKNRILDQEVKAKENQYQNLMQILGGIEELKFAEELKNTFASFRTVKEKMDMLPELEDKHKKMKELEEHVGEDVWIFDQLKEKMISRRNSYRSHQEEIESNFLRLGERFRQECVDTIRSIFPQDDGDAYYKVEEDRKDITAVFIVEGNKRFEVVIECKAIEQYFRNNPLVLVPPLREKDLESVRDQLKKAEKQLSKVETNKVKVTVISVPYERFEEYGIKNEIQFSRSRELEKIIISMPCLRPLLLSLKVLCKNFNPVLDFEKLVDTYSNPEYAEMISQIYGKMREWEETSSKLFKKKDHLDKEYRLFNNYFEKIRRFMKEWAALIQTHHDKALTWTENPKLLSSSEEIEVEEMGENDEIEGIDVNFSIEE